MLDNFAPIANPRFDPLTERERMLLKQTMCTEIITRHALLSGVLQLHGESGCSIGRIVTETFSTIDFVQQVYRFPENAGKTPRYRQIAQIA